MEGARSILLSITGGRDLSLWEVNEAAKAVSEAAHPEANIIFGAMVDEKLDDQVWVTVVATGYGDAPRPSADPHARSPPASRASAAARDARAATPRGRPRERERRRPGGAAAPSRTCRAGRPAPRRAPGPSTELEVSPSSSAPLRLAAPLQPWPGPIARGVRGRRPSRDRAGGRRRAARGRQRRRRRDRRGARVVHGRAAADRARRRRLHARGRSRRGAVLLDFFVEAPGRGADPARRAELVPIAVDFGDVTQMFNAGPASVGTYGMPAGVCEAARRFGSLPLTELVAPAVALAREGVVLNAQQAYVLAPAGQIVHLDAGVRGDLRRRAERWPRGRRRAPARPGRRARAARPPRGRSRSTAARSRPAVVAWLAAAGRCSPREDLAAYARSTARAGAGRLPRPRGPDQPAALGGRDPASPTRSRCSGARRARRPRRRWSRRWRDAQAQRTPEFLEGLSQEGFAERFAPAATRRPAADHARLGGRRRRPGLLGDLLQRRGLGHRRPRHRHPPQQHAGRAGPQPARLPPPPAGAPAAVHDEPDGHAARGRAGAGRRAAAAPTASARRSCRRWSRSWTTGSSVAGGGRRAARCTSRTASSTPSPGADVAGVERGRPRGVALPRAQPVLRRRPGGVPRPGHRRAERRRATRAAAARGGRGVSRAARVASRRWRSGSALAGCGAARAGPVRGPAHRLGRPTPPDPARLRRRHGLLQRRRAPAPARPARAATPASSRAGSRRRSRRAAPAPGATRVRAPLPGADGRTGRVAFADNSPRPAAVARRACRRFTRRVARRRVRAAGASARPLGRRLSRSGPCRWSARAPARARLRQPALRAAQQARPPSAAARSPSAGRAGPAWRRARSRPWPPSRRRSARPAPPGRGACRSPPRRARRNTSLGLAVRAASGSSSASSRNSTSPAG